MSVAGVEVFVAMGNSLDCIQSFFHLGALLKINLEHGNAVSSRVSSSLDIPAVAFKLFDYLAAQQTRCTRDQDCFVGHDGCNW